MHTQRMAVSVSVLALLTLAACGTESGSGSGSGDGSDTVQSDVPVTGVAWSVDSLTVGGKKTEAPAGSRLEIDPKGRAKAGFGCNHISADARVEGDRITFGKPVSTQMACDETTEKAEKAALAAMDGEVTAKLSGEKLTLTTEGGDTIALSEEKPAGLVGTRWAVNTLLSGETATSVPADLPKERVPHLTFGEDGTVHGNSGCNSFHGKAAVEGSTIDFGPPAGTRKMCPEAEMEVERAVLAALDGPATYTIKGSTLTVTSKDGKGIGATAAPAKSEGTQEHG
ncbi:MULTISPECIES: META domain-containing protein [Streptomyces]|uniref:META domain-containing protein n=1 Tax=Streptomyces TaxID=1883 RepID=UPI0004CD55A1|nr:MULTISPECIES: META domain-containing protein [Streptomyces]MEE1727805.1 META domain-containing protein [Streptomyces sp. BE282]QQZ55389.1 META domain-containing protein [Streptomyces microflavus]WSR92727.1 META domain-containing protein [Streptomyces microflavus]